MATATVETAFEPVEFWNALLPNEHVLVTKAADPAAHEYAKFFAGYFRATTPSQVTAIEKYAPHAKRADSTKAFECTSCGWTTKNSDLFSYHIQQHA